MKERKLVTLKDNEKETLTIIQDPELELDLMRTAWMSFVKMRTSCSLITNEQYKKFFPDEIQELAVLSKEKFDKYKKEVYERCDVSSVKTKEQKK